MMSLNGKYCEMNRHLLKVKSDLPNLCNGFLIPPPTGLEFYVYCRKHISHLRKNIDTTALVRNYTFFCNCPYKIL